MNFKDTKYGDLTGEIYAGSIVLNKLYQVDSLEGMPKEVLGSVVIDEVEISTLKYAPKDVSGDFTVIYSSLRDLKYCPTATNYNFKANVLHTMKGIPKKVNSLDVSNNLIEDLDGSPSVVTNTLDLSNNPLLKSLKGNLSNVGYKLILKNCKNLKDVKGEIIRNKIKSAYYETDEGNFTYDEILEDIKSYMSMDNGVKSKGFRSLLGLEKWNLKT